MIFDNIDELINIDFPVIIVGSGPAGISLALKLEKKKIKSLILEAGNKDFSDVSQEFYKSKIFGDEITDLSQSRLRQFGGTSGHWGGWSKPMDDFNLDGWGLKYSDLNNYTEETSKILDIDNKFRKGKINNYFNQIEFQYSEVRFKEKYQDHISKSNYVNIILNAQVLRFIGNENFTNIIECNFKGKNFKIKSKFFVLAAGGIENSRILLWSKEQNNSLIKNNSPIGKYWMTHPWFLGGYGVIKKKKLSNYLNNNFIDNEGPLHIASTKYFKSEKKIMSGSIYMNPSEDEKIYKEIIKDILCVAPKYGKKIARSIFKKDLKCGNIFMHLEESPNIQNKIALDPKIKDPNGVPITNLYYKKSKETLIAGKFILQEFAEMCRKLDLGRIAVKEDIVELINYESLGVYHHIGGTRIGENGLNSVVDKNLRIHDNNNLFVLGSSVFPSTGYTNPTFTIVQLSLRLGDFIFKEIN